MRNSALLMLSAGLMAGDMALAQPMNGGSYPGQAAYGAPAGNDGAMFEVLGRVEQLQSEVQQLRGMVEEQAQTIADLQRKQSNMYSDLDDRLQALTGASTAPAATGSAPTAAAPAGAVSAPAPVTATAVPAPVAQPPINPVQPAEIKPATATVPPPPPSAPVVSGAGAQGSEKERYQLAYDTLRNGHNQQAISMFEGLLRDYPAGEFSDNAQYWLGEAYKINRDYEKARGAFNKVVSQYPDSSKVPDALLKLGFIEYDLQNTAKARDYLTRVVTSYPGTTAAHLASKKLSLLPQ